MKIILLSCGSGNRLWPMSSDNRPKHPLQPLTDESGKPASMLQRIWRQLVKRCLHKYTVIVTEANQRETIFEQLGNGVDLVLEPAQRDTFPAVLLAVAYLHSRRGLHPDETVLVLPVDGMADEPFYETVFQLPEAVKRSGARLGLLGVKPTHPSDKYGYLVPESKPSRSQPEHMVEVSRFREKPSKDEAESLISAGSMWNCGVFCFQARYVLERLESLSLPVSYGELLQVYSTMAKMSFSYAVVEKERRLVSLVYDGTWKDLGIWGSPTGVMRSQTIGPVVMGPI
ncbi:sugar phosphate nucleotidyltransferase [Paenibacillus hamazuiensis]|uniref:sugar phosphate nucleotidyltransferase n=1 Tax=Paenibacillus hamazuiensis TaxID=2936508 RepID=UPI00200D166B